jgi:hypothetical protein
MPCQFCEKTFSYKKNLFVHVGLDHGKMVELMLNYNNADPTEQQVNCRHCDYGADQAEMKAHLAATHYRQSLLALCLEEGPSGTGPSSAPSEAPPSTPRSF